MSKAINLQVLLRRLDEHALEQLCQEVTRLDEENTRLRTELTRMEENAESWREDAMSLHEQLAMALDGMPGINQSGALVVVPMERCA